jgi:hypothetical protein
MFQMDLYAVSCFYLEWYSIETANGIRVQKDCFYKKIEQTHEETLAELPNSPQEPISPVRVWEIFFATQS